MNKSIYIVLIAIILALAVTRCRKDIIDNDQNGDGQNSNGQVMDKKHPIAVISPFQTVFLEQKDCQSQFIQDIILDATESSDPDKGKLHFEWHLGDYQTALKDHVKFVPINADSSKVRVVISELPDSQLPVYLTVSNPAGLKNTTQRPISFEFKRARDADFSITAYPFMSFPSSDYHLYKYTGNNLWIFQQGYDDPQLLFVNPTNEFISPGSQPDKLTNFSVAELNEKLYLIGGGTTWTNTWMNVSEKSVYYFDKTIDRWKAASSLNIARSDPKVLSLGQKIMIGGGYQQAPNTEEAKPVSSIELYDPAINKWDIISPTGLPTSGYALASNNGKAYILGGNNGNNYTTTAFSDRVYIYNDATGQWSETRLPDSLGNVTGVSSGPYIFLSGDIKPRGLRNTKIAMVMDTRNNSIVQHCLSALSVYSRHIMPAGNKILFITTTNSSLQNATIDVYNTQTGQWSVGKFNPNTGMDLSGYFQFWSYQDKIYTNDGQQIWLLNF